MKLHQKLNDFFYVTTLGNMRTDVFYFCIHMFVFHHVLELTNQ